MAGAEIASEKKKDTLSPNMHAHICEHAQTQPTVASEQTWQISSGGFHTFLSTSQGHVYSSLPSKLQGRRKTGIMERRNGEGEKDGPEEGEDGFRCSGTAGLQMKKKREWADRGQGDGGDG